MAEASKCELLKVFEEKDSEMTDEYPDDFCASCRKELEDDEGHPYRWTGSNARGDIYRLCDQCRYFTSRELVNQKVKEFYDELFGKAGVCSECGADLKASSVVVIKHKRTPGSLLKLRAILCEQCSEDERRRSRK